jgi:hypothetical protein
MSRFVAIFLVGCALILVTTALSQAAPPTPLQETPKDKYQPIPENAQENKSAPEASETDLVGIWRRSALTLGLSVLVFAVILIGANFFIMVKSQRYWSDRSFKAFALTLIISAGLFLIVIGFSDKQLAPMMGLLGTLAGYILGASAGESDKTLTGESGKATT